MPIFLNRIIALSVTWRRNIATVEIKNVGWTDVFAIVASIPFQWLGDTASWGTTRLLNLILLYKNILIIMRISSRIIATILLHFQILIYDGKCGALLSTVLFEVAL